jgi:hypothetical protein
MGEVQMPRKGHKIGRSEGWGREEGHVDCTKSYGTVLLYAGKVVSFSKTARFKEKEKEELKTSHIEWGK